MRPILRSFAEMYPDVVLDITLDDEVVDVVAGRYDAAIRIGEVIEKDMVAIRLGPDLRQIAVASPDYLGRQGVPQHPRDLLSHQCIGWRWPGHERPYKWEFLESGQWFEVAVEGPIIANSKELCVQAAIDGVGIAFPTDQLCASHIASVYRRGAYECHLARLRLVSRRAYFAAMLLQSSERRISLLPFVGPFPLDEESLGHWDFHCGLH